jgi:hypothetical protein
MRNDRCTAAEGLDALSSASEWCNWSRMGRMCAPSRASSGSSEMSVCVHRTPEPSCEEPGCGAWRMEWAACVLTVSAPGGVRAHLLQPIQLELSVSAHVAAQLLCERQ